MDPLLLLLLEAIQRDPSDATAYLALADRLEESGLCDQSEFTRLHLRQRTGVGSRAELTRMTHLLCGGIRPIVPTIVNSLGMAFALIPPGVFQMGCPAEDLENWTDQGPQHQQGVRRAFYMGVHLVTQGQYARVMGTNPSYFAATGEGRERVAGLDTTEHPVECVSWMDAMEFCRRLAELPAEHSGKRHYRLPTETEWEYACRGGAGHYQRFAFGDSLCSLVANFDGNHPDGDAEVGPFLNRTTPVGAYPPNGWGVFDMHGNVCEWCHDWYQRHRYSRVRKPSAGPARGTSRVVRGGSFSGLGLGCRSSFRNSREPGLRERHFGFRVLLGKPLRQRKSDASSQGPNG